MPLMTDAPIANLPTGHIAIERADERLAERWCPFGREVQAFPKNVYVFTGADAWASAKARRSVCGFGSALLLPPGEDAANLRWPSVAAGVLVLGHQIERWAALELARCIVSGGTTLAYVIRHGEGFAVKTMNWRNPIYGDAP